MRELVPSGIGRVLSVLGCVLLSACTSAETEYEPGLRAAGTYGSAGRDAKNVVFTEDDEKGYGFYKVFGDAKLNEVIERVLSDGSDIRRAYKTLQQAAVSYSLALDAENPDLSLSVSDRLGITFDDGRSKKSSAADLSMSYELDLAGRLDAESRAGYERFKASAFDYSAMRLMQIRKAAEFYWRYAYANDALTIAEEQLKTSERRLKTVRAGVRFGTADALDYDRALVNHKAVEQNLYQREYELNNAHYALSALLGETPDFRADLAVDPDALRKTVIPKIKADLPAALLRHRPDLKAAEARLRAAVADTDAAEAAFYPSLRLTSSLSSGSAESLGRLLTNPAGALGAALTFPFLNYDELKLREQSSLIAADQARLDFADSFISAVSETADALSSMEHKEKLLTSVRDELSLTERNYERYLSRYTSGDASLSDLLDAADSLRSAQMRALSARFELLKASMSLMSALGKEAFDDSPEAVLQQAALTITDTELVRALPDRS